MSLEKIKEEVLKNLKEKLGATDEQVEEFRKGIVPLKTKEEIDNHLMTLLTTKQTPCYYG